MTVVQPFDYTKKHSFSFKCVNYIVCELYFNKTVFKTQKESIMKLRQIYRQETVGSKEKKAREKVVFMKGLRNLKNLWQI